MQLVQLNNILEEHLVKQDPEYFCWFFFRRTDSFFSWNESFSATNQTRLTNSKDIPITEELIFPGRSGPTTCLSICSGIHYFISPGTFGPRKDCTYRVLGRGEIQPSQIRTWKREFDLEGAFLPLIFSLDYGLLLDWVADNFS